MGQTNFKVIATGHEYPCMDLEKEKLGSIGAELVEADKYSREFLPKVVSEADALLVGLTQIDKRIIESLKRCKVIAEYGVGYDNIDVEAAVKKGICVTHVPDYGTEEVADTSIAMLLCLSRRICELDKLVKSGYWDCKCARPIYRLKDKVLGIVGFGRSSRTCPRLRSHWRLFYPNHHRVERTR